MGRICRQYTPEFKREAMALVTEQGYAVTAAARNLGINPNLFHRWKAAVQQHQAVAFPGQGHQTPEHAELRQLREDNRRLQMDRDISKKRRPSSPGTAHELCLNSRGTADVSRTAALCRIAGEWQWVLSVCATRRRPVSASAGVVCSRPAHPLSVS